MKKILFTIAALFCTTLSFAQEYMIVESTSGQYASFPVSQIKQVFFYTEPEAQEATCAEIIAGEDGVTYRVRGEVTSINNTLYGNWYLKDETGEIYIYGTLDANGQTKNFESLGIAVGDIVTVEGPKKTYNSIVELVNVTVVKIEKPAQGDGTETNPYNVATVLQITKALADGEVINDVYTKGYICQIDNLDTGNYGNAIYWICDDPNGNGDKFEVYRGYGLNGQKFNEEGATLINVGDLVTIKGNVKNYRGTTPEYDQGSIIVSLQPADPSGGEGTQPQGAGTQANPFNVAAAIAKCQEAGTTATTEIYYVKGIVNADYTVNQYKNATFDMVDAEGASEKFKAYRVKGADGKDLKEGYTVPKGATVIVSGQLVNYNGNTPETAQNTGTLISVNGQAPEIESEGGSGETR